MIRQRQRVAFVCLSIYILLGQLLLPNVHAQTWAQRGGNPLLYAICGQMSPGLVEQFRQVAPPELLGSLTPDQLPAQLPCDLCPAVHGVSLAGSDPLVVLGGLTEGSAVLHADAGPAKAHWRIADSRLARGPPISTSV
jgi:hypothetical protein